MAIITISRGSYSKGKEIAEKVAERLGYECIARRILLEASDEFNVSEAKLVRAIHDAPSFFGNLSRKKEKYISFIHAEILEHFRRDNVVYHGLAGHFFVKGISHVLKVRVIADLEDRVELEMDQVARQRAREELLLVQQRIAELERVLRGIRGAENSRTRDAMGTLLGRLSKLETRIDSLPMKRFDPGAN